MSDNEFEITRIAEPTFYKIENKVDVKYTIFVKNLKKNIIESFEEIHPMRHLSLFDIDLLAKKNGFKRVQTEEFLTRKPVNEDTWGVCVTLKKI